MDDCITGAETLHEAVDKCEQTNGLLAPSNHSGRLEREGDYQLIASPSDCYKIWGIHWNTTSATLHAQLQLIIHPTKRQIASEIRRIFDVLGWFAPAIVVLKILLQSLWKQGMASDEPVPDETTAKWKTW